MTDSKSARRVRGSARAQGLQVKLPEAAANDPFMVAFVGQPYVNLSSNNIEHLSERVDVVGKYFDPFDALNKIIVDFSTEKVNIFDINQPEMKSKLLELAGTLRNSAESIERKVKYAKVTDSLDILMPTPGTLTSDIRRHVFDVFRVAASAIGRCGPSATVEDTRDLVQRLVSTGRVEMYKPDPGRSKIKTNDPERWIKESLSRYLDHDMITPARDGVIPAFSAAVYQNSGSLPKLKRFYESLTYWRRNRTRSPESSDALVVARAYEKAHRSA